MRSEEHYTILSSYSLPPKPSHLLIFALFKVMVSFFINYCSMPVCRPIYFPDYNLLSLHNIAHMCSFKATLWYWISSQCALPWRRLIVLLQLMCRQSWWWDFMGVAADITRRHILTEKPLVLWLYQSFHSLFENVPWALGVGVFCKHIHQHWVPHLCTMIGCGFL